jgi:enterochelin esterase-like enzyme
VSLYLGLRYATWFGRLAVLSPSVWWNHKSILGYLNERAPEIWERPRLWLDVGDKEGRRTLHDAEQLNRRLKANGWRQGETLHFERVPGGTHDETSWAKRVRPMLKFLFPAQERRREQGPSGP